MIHRVTINEAEAGLLYRQGRCERRLEPGRHWLWGLDVRIVRIDMRRRLLTVGSQEVLTSDSVQLRISVMVAFSVTDPARAMNEFESYEHELHLAAQLALRTAVGERGFDELIEHRLDLGERLAELVAAMAPDLGVRIESVRLRDVMLPGTLKSAFAEVLQARAEGRAALERARGESAALRSLANAARTLDATPGLMNLRMLQTIEQDAALPGTTRFVVHLPQGTGTQPADGDELDERR